LTILAEQNAPSVANALLQRKGARQGAVLFEIRKRAERRLGEMIAELPKNPGVRVAVGPRRVRQKPTDTPTLLDSQIAKNLADRARRAYAMPRREFEEMIRRGREEIYRSAERAATSKADRKEKHRRIAARAKPTRPTTPLVPSP
jgi:hypothetical protein